MNEHIHVDGDDVIIYGHRLTLDEARAAAGALRAALVQLEVAEEKARAAERRDRERNQLLAVGWEISDDPAVLVRLIPGQEWCARGSGWGTLRVLTHRPVPVRVYGGRMAHIATGAPYCACGTFVRAATVLADDHRLPMCRAHREGA